MKRKELTCSKFPVDVITKMCEGNIRAAAILGLMMKKNCNQCFAVISLLDDMNIRGNQIVSSWKACENSTTKLMNMAGDTDCRKIVVAAVNHDSLRNRFPHKAVVSGASIRGRSLFTNEEFERELIGA